MDAGDVKLEELWVAVAVQCVRCEKVGLAIETPLEYECRVSRRRGVSRQVFAVDERVVLGARGVQGCLGLGKAQNVYEQVVAATERVQSDLHVLVHDLQLDAARDVVGGHLEVLRAEVGARGDSLSRKEKGVSGALAGEPLKKEPLKAKSKCNPFTFYTYRCAAYLSLTTARVRPPTHINKIITHRNCVWS